VIITKKKYALTEIANQKKRGKEGTK